MSINKLENLNDLSQKFQKLSSREKNLIKLTLIVAAIIPIYLAVTYTRDFYENFEKKVKVESYKFDQIQDLVIKHRTLKNNIHKLRSRYLNSSLSYEELTKHLDKILKIHLKTDAYDLIPSRDRSELGTDFIAQKFTLRIKKIPFNQIIEVLKDLEIGPPPVLVEKVDITESNEKNFNSVTFEIMSIQKKE